MLAPVMKRKGKNVGTSYEEEGEECWHQLERGRGRMVAPVMKRKGKNVGTNYEEEGEECWHQL